MCVLKMIKVERENLNIPGGGKKPYKMIFRPEHAEVISYVYVVNQIFESVSDLFAKKNQKR